MSSSGEVAIPQLPHSRDVGRVGREREMPGATAAAELAVEHERARVAREREVHGTAGARISKRRDLLLGNTKAIVIAVVLQLQ